MKVNDRTSWFISSLAALISLVIGALVSYSVDEVYMARATLQIGHVGFRKLVLASNHGHIKSKDIDIRQGGPVYADFELLESQRSLGEVLRGKYSIPQAKKNQLPLPFLYHIELRVDGVVNLFSRGRSSEESEEVLREILEWIQKRHDHYYDLSMVGVSKLKDDLKEAMIVEAATQSRLQEVSVTVESTKKQEAETSERELNNQSIARLYREVIYSLLPYYTKRTAVISPPTASEKRLKPKVLLYAATTLIVSFFVFLSVFTSSLFLRKVRKDGIQIFWE